MKEMFLQVTKMIDMLLAKTSEASNINNERPASKIARIKLVKKLKKINNDIENLGEKYSQDNPFEVKKK